MSDSTLDPREIPGFHSGSQAMRDFVLRSIDTIEFLSLELEELKAIRAAQVDDIQIFMERQPHQSGLTQILELSEEATRLRFGLDWITTIRVTPQGEESRFKNLDDRDRLLSYLEPREW